MNTWVVALVSSLLGLGLGLGMTYARVDLFPPPETRPSEPPNVIGDPRTPKLPPADGPQPVAVFDHVVYNFGKMEFNTKSSHTFTVRNEGGYPLRLAQGDTSCKCTIGTLGSNEIPPGGSTEITLKWETVARFDEFRQSATIFTNDPQHQRVDLVVEGKILATVQTHPKVMNFGTVLAHESQTTEVRVYSSHLTPIEPQEVRVIDPALEPYLKFSFERMAKDEAEFLGGLSGFVLRGTLLPGLPLGNVSTVAEIGTNLAEIEAVKLAVEARIAPDLSLVGGGWRGGTSSRGVLSLGTLVEGRRHERTVKILVRGPDRGATEIRVGRIEPDVLQVSVGQRRTINQGNVVEIPLTIAVPADCPPMTYRGRPGEFGTVVIETNHPQVPQVTMLIDFAVRPDIP